MKELRFVTGNAHKFSEIIKIFESELPDITLVQSKEPLEELQADTLEKVAEFKVKSILDRVPLPYFIEDAGFFVDDICKGFPGVYSSYVMKTIGNSAILKIMGESGKRKAHFESVIAYIDEKHKINFFKGINLGQVALEARGTSGFGFDPIFISDDTPEKTFAELTTGEKNKISHRSRAIAKLLHFLKQK